MVVYVFPGQGSQRVGMGGDLFDEFSDLTEKADKLLGYSIKELCLEDKKGLLNQTQYTQPALFVVNALMYHKIVQEDRITGSYLAGHSLGEYNALYAAGVLNFESALKLVIKRGKLMSKAKKGSMAAVIGWDDAQLKECMAENKLDNIDIANYNSPKQIVVSGMEKDIEHAMEIIEECGGRCIKLKVSGAFHSRYMREAGEEFGKELENTVFNKMEIPVISNVTAQVHLQKDLKQTMVLQMSSSVRWTETIELLLNARVDQIVEIGPGSVLTGLTEKIKKSHVYKPVDLEAQVRSALKSEDDTDEDEIEFEENILNYLGDVSFREDYHVDYPYVHGSIGNGISSSKMVLRALKVNMLGILDTENVSLNIIESEIIKIKKGMKKNQVFGLGLSYMMYQTEKEKAILRLAEQYGVTVLEISNYMRITPELSKYRLHGVHLNHEGQIQCKNKIIVKVNRIENARLFMESIQSSIVQDLLNAGEITEVEAELAQYVPFAEDICIDNYSLNQGGGLSALYLFDEIVDLRREIYQKQVKSKKIRIGIGGIGSPQLAAFMFSIGMDFILNNTINQCNTEAELSETAKKMLQIAGIEDLAYAPSGEFFEFGERRQVLKKGVLFHARANKLYDIYKRYNSFEEIDEKMKIQLEEKYFGKSFEKMFEECKVLFDLQEIQKAEKNPKLKMSFAFRYYLYMCSEWAKQGNSNRVVDFGIRFDDALGALNKCVRGTSLEKWQNRSISGIALYILSEASKLLQEGRFIAYRKYDYSLETNNTKKERKSEDRYRSN